MAGVDWQGFLQGLRESIEKIRTPIDPIAIQGTANRMTAYTVIPTGSAGSVSLYPPSDGYNRVAVLCRCPPNSELLLNHQPSQGPLIQGYALHNPLTGAHINPVSSVWYTVEIPDRDSFLQLDYDNQSGDQAQLLLNCVFWRQY